jgi:flagellar hook-basal body complex protein FliE
MSGLPLEALSAVASPETLSVGNVLPADAQPAAAQPAGAPSFSQILMDGIAAVNERVANADAMVRAFAVDDSIPLHQVTFALEEARLSMELMMQVRARLVESYQRMMEMQL